MLAIMVHDGCPVDREIDRVVPGEGERVRARLCRHERPGDGEHEVQAEPGDPDHVGL